MQVHTHRSEYTVSLFASLSKNLDLPFYVTTSTSGEIIDNKFHQGRHKHPTRSFATTAARTATRLEGCPQPSHHTSTTRQVTNKPEYTFRRGNKERDITTVLGRTKSRSPQLRKRARPRAMSLGGITRYTSKDSSARRVLKDLTQESTPKRQFKTVCFTEHKHGGRKQSRVRSHIRSSLCTRDKEQNNLTGLCSPRDTNRACRHSRSA
jgi:hypothetical protein